MATDIELAWAAGFFDGEGSMGLNKAAHKGKNYTSPLVCIGQNDPWVLQRFCSILGVGRVYGPYKYRTGNKQYWTYQAGGLRAVRNVYAQLRAFLGPLKTAQFESLLLPFVGYDVVSTARGGKTLVKVL